MPTCSDQMLRQPLAQPLASVSALGLNAIAVMAARCPRNVCTSECVAGMTSRGVSSMSGARSSTSVLAGSGTVQTNTAPSAVPLASMSLGSEARPIMLHHSMVTTASGVWSMWCLQTIPPPLDVVHSFKCGSFAHVASR